MNSGRNYGSNCLKLRFCVLVLCKKCFNRINLKKCLICKCFLCKLIMFFCREKILLINLRKSKFEMNIILLLICVST